MIIQIAQQILKMQTSLQQLDQKEKEKRAQNMAIEDFNVQEARQVKIQIKNQIKQTSQSKVQQSKPQSEFKEVEENEKNKLKTPIMMKSAIRRRTRKNVGDKCEGEVQQKKFSLFQKSKKYLCKICEKEVQFQQTAKLCTCEHIFCKECLNHYVLYRIRRFEQIICPQENCNNLLDENSNFYISFPKQTRSKYKQNKKFYTSLNNSNQRLCPTEKCDGILKTSEQKISSCNKCQKIFCQDCFFEKHQGNCQNYYIQFFQKKLHYRQCSKCKMIIQKMSGCNHITCECSYEFCYKCGKTWSTAHKCPGMIHEISLITAVNRQVQPQPERQLQCFNMSSSGVCQKIQRFFSCLGLIAVLVIFLIFLILLAFGFFIVGLICGPFIYFQNLFTNSQYVMLVIMIILFPFSMMMGVYIIFSEYFGRFFRQHFIPIDMPRNNIAPRN